MKIIDLSVPLNNDTPPFPGDASPRVEVAATVEKDGYHDHTVSFNTHIGTHVDAPAHMVAGALTLDQIPLEQFMGKAKLIKVDGAYSFDVVKQANIQVGDIVLFWTGMSLKYHELEYFEKYPAMPKQVAQYLVDKKVKMVGLDCASPDYEPFEEHRILLGGNVLIAENLTNLDKLEGLNFEIIALPINMQGDGAPARVIAKL
jgi:arylformamidase